jgi:flagellar capping protein FliD
VASSSSGIFTGSSSYSQDFQNVITRAVSIASLPIAQMTSDQTALSNASNELTKIDQKFTSLQSALDGVSQALSSSFDTQVSDDSVLTASVGSGAVEGNYSILVSDPGAYSTMMTKAWSAADGDPRTYQLVIGSDSYAVTPADNSATSVAAAINRSYGDKVHATVVNVGSADAPSHRLSLQSVDLTRDLLDLEDGVSLKDQQTAGKPARYEVNNSGTVVESASRTISVSDGVTLTLEGSSPDAVDVTVTRSTSALSTALGALVSAYNETVKELDAQRGTSGGPLQSTPVVQQLSSALSRIATYVGSGGVSGLKDLGVELQKDGTLTQDPWQLLSMDFQNSSGVTWFFNDFLEAANAVITGVEDPANGVIKKAEVDYTSQISDITKRIDDKQAQVDDLQLRLLGQMAAADALIASMEQQYNYMYSMFQAMQTADQQYK